MNHAHQSHSPPENAALIPHPSASPVIREPYYGVNSRYGFESTDEGVSESGLLEYWRILRRHKRAVLLSGFMGLLLGFLVGIPMKPVYRARTSLEVLSLNDDFMNTKQSNPIATNDGSYETSEEETQGKLLQSAALMKRVFSKLHPNPENEAVENPRAPATGGWRKWFHLSEPLQMDQRQTLLNQAAATLKIRIQTHTRVIEASVDSSDPQLAADFANTLVQEFIEQNLEARYNSTQKTGEWLRREIDDARTKLQASEDALQTYARESGLIFTDESTNVSTEKLQQVQQELSAATADRIAKQSRFELAKTSPPDALADVLNDTGLRETNSKMNDLRRQIADLSAVYNSEYSKIKRAQAELATLQSAFDGSRADILKRIENDYREAIRKENLLSAAYSAQTQEVSGQGEKAIQYNILKREVDSNRQLYDTMLQQTKQASIASAMRASNVRIVDPAEKPTSPFSPNTRLNSGLGLFLGLLLGASAILIRENADRTLQQPGDVKLWTDLPELGTIPSASVSTKTLYGNAYGEGRVDLTSPANDPALGSHNGRLKVELVTLQRKPSVIAEAFRSALTSILFVGENGSRPRVLVFTSASPGDGKTTIVSNIAIATAEIRRRVLVIDADLRRPRMHEVFNLPNARGLTDLLSEEFSEKDLYDLIQETSIPGVHVLTGGPPVQAAAHLLYSPNFAALLGQLRSEYDMILIDTPPMLQMTDARVVGRLADAVVLVARAGQTTRDALLAVKERFGEDRIRMLGTILNDWDPKHSPAGYYGKHNGSYYKAGTAYSSKA